MIPGSGRSLGVGSGNPFQHSCLGNFMDRGAWWGTVYGVTKGSDTTERLATAKSVRRQNAECAAYGACWLDLIPAPFDFALKMALRTWCVCVLSRSFLSDSLRPRDWSPPGSSVLRISQGRILGWVAISCSRKSSRARDQIPCLVFPASRWTLCNCTTWCSPVRTWTCFKTTLSL